jgi:hypothetical protein
MGMMVVRHERRTAKSIRWQNFQVDMSVGVHGAISALFAIPTLTATSATGIPLVVMAIGLAFTVWRALEKTVKWEEACLLHAMASQANFLDVIDESVALGLGQVMVEKYGYVKGQNANEIQDIIDRLVGWKALERVPGGYKILESVRFWQSPWQSSDEKNM